MNSPSYEQIRETVQAILVSAGFANSDRMARFLQFIAEKKLNGQASDIREYSLGTEVFDRPESFDSKTDTIVRVEARRLRKKLQEYYEGPGAGSAVRIEIPTPG